ncbi:MAG: hypothetical protein NC237_04245 [Eubacterium sp.]|nr:hypothetical protein [Eubacterium sp.]
MTGYAFDAQLHDIFSAILHRIFLKGVSLPAKILCNLTKNLPHIYTPIIVRCSLKRNAP